EFSVNNYCIIFKRKLYYLIIHRRDIMKHVYFITGFPGFLAEQLLIQLYKDYQKQINHVYLLTLPSTKSQAQNRLNFFTRDNNLNESNFTLIEGDITAPGLDMSVSKDVTTNITHVFHLAAVYD